MFYLSHGGSLEMPEQRSSPDVDLAPNLADSQSDGR
jgi:hypothetical protein